LQRVPIPVLGNSFLLILLKNSPIFQKLHFSPKIPKIAF